MTPREGREGKRKRVKEKKVVRSGDRSFRRQRQVDCWEFKNILVYTVSSRTPKSDPVSGETKVRSGPIVSVMQK